MVPLKVYEIFRIALISIVAQSHPQKPDPFTQVISKMDAQGQEGLWCENRRWSRKPNLPCMTDCTLP